MQQLGVEAWYAYYKPSGVKPTQVSGVLGCFCMDQAEELGSAVVKETVYSGKNGQSAEVCYEFFKDKEYVLLVGKSLALSINVVNVILKMMITKLAFHLKLDTVSGFTYAIMISVFIAQFFNTAMMLTLVNANFRDNSDDPDVSYWFSGSFTDFNEDWYAVVGATLIKTMLIGAFMPPIEFCI